MSEIIYRAIKVTVWNDEKFFTLSDDAQLVWFHLFTNPMTNGLGLYAATVEGLSAHKRWPLERYREGFEEGLGKRLFEYDVTYQSVYFPKFIKHNKPSNPNVMQSLLKCWDYIPPTPIKHQVYRELEGLGKGFAKRLREMGLTLPPTLPQTIPETVTGTDTVTGTVKNTPSQDGENLSTEYIPRRHTGGVLQDCESVNWEAQS